MKTTPQTPVVRLASLLFALLVTLSVAQAQTFGSGSLTTSDPTFHQSGQSTSGTAIQYYDVYQFSVTTSGSYVFELSSLNTTNSPSNALDTYMLLYATTFNPASPNTQLSSNDDYTGTFTVLPGPFAGSGYTTTSTGFSGAQPGSRFTNASLTLGTNYFLVVSSFRATDFVGTGTNAQPVGNYVFGISGPGTAVLVPEPATTALLIVAAGGLALLGLRKRKAV